MLFWQHMPGGNVEGKCERNKALIGTVPIWFTSYLDSKIDILNETPSTWGKYREVHSNHEEEGVAIQSTAGGNAGACVRAWTYAHTHAHREQMNPTLLHCEGWDLLSFCMTSIKGWLIGLQIIFPKIKAETSLGHEQGSSFPNRWRLMIGHSIIVNFYYLKITLCTDCSC